MVLVWEYIYVWLLGKKDIHGYFIDEGFTVY